MRVVFNLKTLAVIFILAYQKNDMLAEQSRGISSNFQEGLGMDKIAVVQQVPVFLDRKKIIDKAVSLTAEAVANSVQMETLSIDTAN